MPLDIGIGLLLGILLNSQTEINYELSLLLGVTAALLPDLDFVWQKVTGKYSYLSNHRDGLHYPLIFIPVVALLGYLFNPWLGAVFAIGALTHFIHDSIGLGWGIKWLFPFSNTSYLFFYKVGLPTNKYQPKKLIYAWTDSELQSESKKYADPDWIKHIYFQFHPYGITEYIVLVLGITAAIIYK